MDVRLTRLGYMAGAVLQMILPWYPFFLRAFARVVFIADPRLRAPGDLTIYDAAYVSLAEGLKVVLLTADRRLARQPGPGPGPNIEVLSPSTERVPAFTPPT